MIIDAHTHIGLGKNLYSDARKLRRSMARAGIDKALVFAGELNGCPTEKLLEVLEMHRGVLFPVGSISPLLPNLPSPQRVEELLSQGEIFGLKFYTGYEFFYPNYVVLHPYLALLEKYRKPAIFHSGDTYHGSRAKLKYAHPLHIDDIAVDFSRLSIIIAHLGYPWVIDAAEVVYKNKNVNVDCSGLAYGALKKADKKTISRSLQQFFDYEGCADKLLFGSDWPVAKQPEYVEYVSSLFSKKHRKRIMGENSRALFGI